MKAGALVLASVSLLSGCASTLTGYSSESEHSCPNNQARGVPCTPVSDVYRQAMAGQLPGQLASTMGRAPATATGAQPSGAENVSSAAMRPAMSSGMPVRTAPRVLRIWFAPWKDELDVLHDQRHSYLTLDTGRWLIEHNQQRMIREFAPTRLLQGSDGAEQPQSPNGARAGQLPAAASPAERAANPGAATLPPLNPGSR
jgi:conjugal transfer pilus assembly protein TraV